MIWTTVYVFSIVLVNWLFVVVPPLVTPFGNLYLATLVVGVVFVLRDYAQREIGHKVLLGHTRRGRSHLFHGGPGYCCGQYYGLRAV